MDQRKFWIGFNLVKGIGAVRFQQIQAFFGDLSVAWQAPGETFKEIGLPGRVLNNLLSLRNEIDLDQVYDSILSCLGGF